MTKFQLSLGFGLFWFLSSFGNAWGIMHQTKNLTASPSDTAEVPFVPTLENYRRIANPESIPPTQDDDHTFHELKGPLHIHDPASDELDIQIEMSSTTNLTGKRTHYLYFIVHNRGNKDEYIQFNVSDDKGYAQELPPTEFYLPSGSSHEISILMDYPEDADRSTPDIITVNASGKGRRNTVKRSAFYYPGGDYSEYNTGYYQTQPFCYDRYVTGNCRYRTERYECDKHYWTAHATVQSPTGIQFLRSIPDGVFTTPEFIPGTRDHVKVSLQVTCCVQYVQFVNVNPAYPNVGTACIVDVKELQGLNPAEIAGIVVGVVILLVIIITVIALLIRRKRGRSVMVGQPVSTAESTN